MNYDLHNPTKATHILYEGRKEIRITPGQTIENIELSWANVKSIRSARVKSLVLTDHLTESNTIVYPPSVVEPSNKPPLIVDGMWGIGDNLHQRAIMRKLMVTHDVWLTTCHWLCYHDLIRQGLKLIFKSTRLRAQSKTIEREKRLFIHPPVPLNHAHQIKLWYRKDQIDVHGSILEAMAGVCGVDKTNLDFSLPILGDWKEKADSLLSNWNMEGKLLLLYRPIVQRKEWNSANRNPHIEDYSTLYESIRKDFFTVSIADLEDDKEWIVGPEAYSDIQLHRGELDFPTMAALVARAKMVFCNAGFMPVLAQAVGTPAITVYGGRESYRTTQRAGAHLAPTLGIDPKQPCDCHTERHACGDKKIDIPRALALVRKFVDNNCVRSAEQTLSGSVEGHALEEEVGSQQPQARQTSSERNSESKAGVESGPPRANILIFATTYCDCSERAKLTDQWLTLTTAKNPGFDILLVDSSSPYPLINSEKWDFETYQNGKRSPFMLHDFGDNVGHLSRGGKDGWGRAFCFGLDAAVANNYEYVIHIEGDSLFRLPVAPIIEEMRAKKIQVASVPVLSGKRQMGGWVETGLMIFSTDWLRKSKFTELYNWQRRAEKPTPEIIVYKLCAKDLHLMPWKAARIDKLHLTKNEIIKITHENIESLNLDWITHAHDDIWVYEKFLELNMPKESEVMPVAGPEISDDPPRPNIVELPQPSLKLNLGCGTNKLPGWENHDSEVDITKPLPWSDNSVDYIFIEHCVEHVSFHEAIRFFEEAFRVLKPGGVFRITVPSFEQIAAQSEQDYWEFTKKWGGEATLKGALRAILFNHGHQQAWTASLMQHSLQYAGFTAVEPQAVGESRHPPLKRVEGHGKVIGDKFNKIESMCFEGTKPGLVNLSRLTGERIAVVLGGAESVWDDLRSAQATIAEAGASPTYFAINDMIASFNEPCIAVTLHPAKIDGWLLARRDKGFPVPSDVWAHRPGHPKVTRHTIDWAGSSGLFSVKIARELGFERIVLCGVPMKADNNHFVRHIRWNAAQAFQRGWLTHKEEIAPYVRSMSGWTKDLLGGFAIEFLSKIVQAA